MRNFNNIPDFIGLTDNNQAYFTDDEYTASIQNSLRAKHADVSNKIKVLPLTFLKSTIDSQSSLYSEDYTRTIANTDMLDESNIETAFTNLERFTNLHRRSAIYASTGADGKLKLFALDPTRYFKQDEFSFVSIQQGVTLLYVETGSSVDVYTILLPLSEAVEGYDLDKPPLEQYQGIGQKISLNEKTGNDVLHTPLVEAHYYNNTKALYNDLVTIQTAYIEDISWGIKAGSVKLVSQAVLESNIGVAKAKKMLAHMGSNTNVIQTNKGDKLYMFEPGDVKVLLDLFDMYKQIVKQIAIQKGADITAIIPETESGSESAKAKMVKLNYINKARKNYAMIYKPFERELWDKLGKAFNIDFGYDSITFPNLKVNETEGEKLDYNERLYNLNLLNFQRLYALTFNISYEKAGLEIKKYGLSPDTTQNFTSNLN